MRFELRSVNMDSIGNPEPKEVRVFSTMNGPQILASFLAVGSIIAFSSRHRIRWVAIRGPVVFGAFARALWLGGRGRRDITGTRRIGSGFVWSVAVLAVVVMIGALQNPDLQQVMSQRFDTLTDVRNDTSFMDRVESYRALFAGFLYNPFGLAAKPRPRPRLPANTLCMRLGGDLGTARWP